MNKIKWCCNQKKGIKVEEIREHLINAYMKEAEGILNDLSKVTGKWKVIMAYYSCYNALYSILMKCGISCEIHECTIELMALFGFTNEEYELMKELKSDRIDNQYYLKDKKLKDEKEIFVFVNRCKQIIKELNSQEIEEIRTKLKKEFE